MSPPSRPNAELVDARGRKYLTADERTRFLAAVRAHPKPTTQTLARTLAMTGCRVREALGLRACDVDLEAAELRIATLKRRREHWRAVPIIQALRPGAPRTSLPGVRTGTYATFVGHHPPGRAPAGDEADARCRHRRPPGVTAIYTTAIGAEARELVSRAWG